ncbi:MAG: CoA-binding protein [Kangiellaceae bacterium]|nr:CoA-binding protein [Kangiellaceae bacterium]MCW8998875.1 CoA-binding protein [Kangiellaceae bacterium]
MTKPTLILGASDKLSRYSNKAMKSLITAGHPVVLFNPNLERIEDLICYQKLSQIAEAIDTITVYVHPKRIEPMLSDLIALNPRRVIFNPGSESYAAQEAFENAGIEVENACTLVLLSLDQY